MRTVFILFISLFFNSLFAQNNFAKELNQIIKDTASNFNIIKGRFKEMRDNDSIYYSTITLDGTKENDVIVNQMLTMYRSVVIDSVNERQGKKIVDEWYQNLLVCWGRDINLKK
jgi:hypothetical protein